MWRILASCAGLYILAVMSITRAAVVFECGGTDNITAFINKTEDTKLVDGFLSHADATTCRANFTDYGADQQVAYLTCFNWTVTQSFEVVLVGGNLVADPDANQRYTNIAMFLFSRWGLCMMGWITKTKYTDKFVLASENTSIRMRWDYLFVLSGQVRTYLIEDRCPVAGPAGPTSIVGTQPNEPPTRVDVTFVIFQVLRDVTDPGSITTGELHFKYSLCSDTQDPSACYFPGQCADGSGRIGRRKRQANEPQPMTSGEGTRTFFIFPTHAVKDAFYKRIIDEERAKYAKPLVKDPANWCIKKFDAAVSGSIIGFVLLIVLLSATGSGIKYRKIRTSGRLRFEGSNSSDSGSTKQSVKRK